MTKNYKPGFTYQEFGPQLTAEFFDPIQWASIIKDSGAKLANAHIFSLIK